MSEDSKMNVFGYTLAALALVATMYAMYVMGETSATHQCANTIRDLMEAR